MKKYLNEYNIILTLYIGLLLMLGYKVYQDEIEIRKLKRVEYLINEGYSIEASKHITNVEFGVIPVDYEHQALMED